MIYDGFLFHNELDLLDLRLNILNEIVDYFIIVEGTITHSGKNKELLFERNRDRYKNFLHKIIHIVVDDTPETNNNYERQQFQRDAIMRPLENCSDDDILIVSDVDEIPSVDSIKEAIKYPFCKINMPVFYYFLNVLVNSDWNHPYIATIKFIKDHSSGPTSLRHSGCENVVNGGWHFSYLSGINQIKEKLCSFGASDKFGKKEILDNIESAIRNLHSPWDLEKNNGNYDDILDINNESVYPEYITSNSELLIQKNLVHPRKDYEEDLLPLKYTNNWFNYSKFYDWIVNNHSFNKFVEVGCWKGHSISYLAKLLKEKKDIEIFGIDLFEDVPLISGREIEIKFIRQIYNMILKENNVNDLIKTIKSDSSSAANLFENNSIDFVFIDANHNYESVKKDIQSWFPKVKNNGIISGHDWPYVEKAVKDCLNNNINTTDENVWFVYKEE